MRWAVSKLSLIEQRFPDLPSFGARRRMEQVMALADERIGGLMEELAASQVRVSHLEAEREDLNKARRSAEGRVAHLEGELQTLKEALAAAGEELRRKPREVDPIYRKVGLDRDCPDFVWKACRTAYRKHLHPDHKPVHLKTEAERRFKEAESVFADIERSRGE